MNIMLNLFEEATNKLKVQDTTKSYIVSTLINYKSNYIIDIPICIKFSEATFNNDFKQFQEIADFILFAGSIYPAYFKNMNEEYFISLGQMSYLKCYKLINKQWKLYEELADKLPEVTRTINVNIGK